MARTEVYLESDGEVTFYLLPIKKRSYFLFVIINLVVQESSLL
jgi:hypothetical protein